MASPGRPKANPVVKDSEVAVVDAPAVHIPEEEIKFFGEADKDDKGRVMLDMPSWYDSRNLDNLMSEVAVLRSQLDSGMIPPEAVPRARKMFSEKSERIELIKASMVSLTNRQRDQLSAEAKIIGKAIADSMYSRSDMMAGIDDYHNEADRMSKHWIELTEWQAKQLQESGRGQHMTKIENGKWKTNRVQAEKLWKMFRAKLGENTNIEILRNKS